MADQITYENFVSQVEHMVENRESGALFVRTDTNHSVVLTIDKGEIVSLISGPRQGIDAMERILEMASCSLRRDDNLLTSLGTGAVPSTSEILHHLKQGKAVTKPSAPDAQEGVRESSGGDAKPIDPNRAGKVLCDLLHEYLGPVAPMICDDVTFGGQKLSTSSQLVAAINSLAREIDSASEAKEFKERAYKRLGDLLA